MADELRSGRQRRQRRRRLRRRRLAAAGVGVVVVGAGGAAALAASAGNGTGQQIATVGRASVTQVVDSSGTIASSEKVTPSFAVSGTVRSVDVQVGEPVSKGQVLARLDSTSLRSKVDSVEQVLAQARQQLEADKTGQTSGAGSGSGGGSGSGSTLGSNSAGYTALVTASAAAPTAPAGSTTLSALIRQIQAAQRAVIAAEQAADAGQAAVDAAEKTMAADAQQNTRLRDAQKQACSTDATSADCASARANYEAYADTLSGDSSALDGAVAGQDAAVQRLDSAITALGKLLTQLPAAASGSGHAGGSGSGGSGSGGGSQTGSGKGTVPSGSGGSSTTKGSGSGNTTSTTSSGTTGQTASAAQLAADQASIDAAEAELRAAKQDLAAATLRSPISGKVASVGYTAGSDASGQSITVVGTGVQKVSTTVTLAEIKLVKKGQSVSVAADGVSAPLHGTVTTIGLLSSTSGSSVTFPVTVQLDARSPKLYDGVGADVEITTGSARDVVAVPNSAIHSLGSLHTVTVVKGSTTTTERVGLGVAGADLTEVTSGLKVGDRVVLADLSEKLPASTNSSNSNSRIGRFFGTGGALNLPAFGSR